MSRRRRRRPRSPPPPPAPVPPLEDDNLLSEILLRLPPDPPSLPRASLVSKRWLGLVSDPGFCRRFRLHHRHNPPLIGFFEGFRFQPTMDPPNRVPDGHFSVRIDTGGMFRNFGSRHGLLLTFHGTGNQLLVWDPFNVAQHRVAVPPGFDEKKHFISGAVYRAAGDIQHFQVVLVSAETDELQHRQVIARVYSSETGAWGDRISTPCSSKLPTNMGFSLSVLVGHSLYWLFVDISTGRVDGIVEFDLEMQILAVKPMPVDIAKEKQGKFQLMRAEGGGLGILFLLKFSAQLWKMETDSDGVASWVLGRTVELDKLLPLNLEEEENSEEEECSEEEDNEFPFPGIQGFAEYNNVVFLWTHIHNFTVQLESLQFKKVSRTHMLARYHPFESAYAAGTGIGGGHDGTKLLHNT
ncbi:uncharacterized protein [Aegilops tauschii subsp. strangulata]